MTKDDEYQLCLDYVKGLIESRKSVSTTYLSVNAAISAAIAFFFKDGQLSDSIDEISALTLLAAGIVASGLWRRLVRQYTTLIGWWYEQLRNLEADMSNFSRPITREHQKWYAKQNGRVAIGITQYEIGLTWVFTTIYVLFSLGIVLSITGVLA